MTSNATTTIRAASVAPFRRCVSFGFPAVAALLLSILLSGCIDDPCNGQCGPGEVCDEVHGACVPPGGGNFPGSCSQNADCTSLEKPHCDMLTGRCVQCADDGHCAAGRRCDQLTQVCVDRGCMRESDCDDVPGKPICSSSGVCVECNTSNDCPVVDGQRRTCSFPDRVCVVNPCRSDAECQTDSGGRICHLDSGRCVQCLGDDDCTVGTHQRCRPQTNQCVQCLEDDDCNVAEGEICDPALLRCRITGCQTDAHCDGPSLCQTHTRECVRCLDDEHCTMGGSCGEAGLCVDAEVCEGDEDCVWPLTCESGRCVSCRSDEECGEGRLCSEGRCVEPESCVTSASCDANRVCAEGSCVASGCIPDAFSPNGSPRFAAPIRTGIIDARLCPNEEDWFAVDFKEGAGAEVIVRSDAAHGAPRLELHWGEGRPSLAATGVSRTAGILTAALEVAGPGDGPLLVRVWSAGETTIPYSLETRVFPQGFCADDEREPDNRYEDATLLEPGQYSGILCPEDLDWIAVDVPTDSRLVATLSLADGDPELAEIRVFTLVDSTLTQIAEGADIVRADPNLTGATRRYWVSLASLDGERSLEYVVTLDIAPRPPANDSCDDARVLVPGGWRAGTTVGAMPDGIPSCAGDGGRDVFWSLELEEASSVDLQLDASFHGSLTLETACGVTELACLSSESSTRRLTFDGLPEGTYVVRVATSGTQSGTYALRADVGDAPTVPPGIDCDTAEELILVAGSADSEESEGTGGGGGGSISTATVLGNLSLATDALESPCGASGSDAVYGFSISERRRFHARLDAFPGASLSLVPADQCGEEADFCAAIAPGAGHAVLDRPFIEAGDWRLIVDGGSHRTGAFELLVELDEPILPPDNDVCEDASELLAEVSGDTRAASDAHTPPAACSSEHHAGGDVVYRLVVEREEDVHLTLNAGFDASLTVSTTPCGTGTVLACGDGSEVKLRLPALEPGEYFVWVDAWGSAAGPFTLVTDRLPPTPLPSNDLCESAEGIDLSSGPVTVNGSTSRAANDIEPSTCRRGSPPNPASPPMALDGRDVAYAVEVPAGATLVARLEPTFDAALYLLDTCDAKSCLAASDEFTVTTEEIQWSNTGEETRTVRVVVDSWRDDQHGAFELTVELLTP